MSKIFIAAAFCAATLAGAGVALAEPQDGTTLAGGNNGADAKAASTMKVEGATNRGSAAAPVAPGQSTEKPDGKMRAGKNF